MQLPKESVLPTLQSRNNGSRIYHVLICIIFFGAPNSSVDISQVDHPRLREFQGLAQDPPASHCW